MPEYIEREALRAEALRLTKQTEFPFDNCFPYWQFSKCIKEAPAADVESVRHGKWLINSDGYYPYCSECKEEPKSGIMTNYCPNCGAKLDLNGKDDNE